MVFRHAGEVLEASPNFAPPTRKMSSDDEFELVEVRETKRTVTMTTTKTTKLLGQDVHRYDEMDFDELLSKLTNEEIEILSKEVDPDDNLLPPSQRCRDQTSKSPTGPLNRKHLLDFLERSAREEEDWPERIPYQPGVIRGKIWTPKELPKPPREEEDGIALDLDDEYEKALETATEDELVDLAAILGLHSMVSQDQYYSAITNKKRTFATKFESIVKASQPRAIPFEPDNSTDVDKSIEQVHNNDGQLTSLNWNNIKNVSIEKFQKLFEGLKSNTKLQQLSLANTRMTDKAARVLCDALEKNKSLKTLNVESNFISPPMIRDLIQSLLKNQAVEDFRAANQRPEVLGVKTEMEIAKLIEENKNILRLGLPLEVPDARIRVHHHLQQTNDNRRRQRISKKL